jgi:hypothetical protein
MAKQNNTVPMQGRIVKETAKAVLVDSMNFFSQLDPYSGMRWIPKSVCEITRYENGNADFQIDFWFAKQLGLTS